jgi:hypothetical protein
MTAQVAEPKVGTDGSESSHQVSQPHLAKQDASTVDPTKLTALTPEVVSKFVENAILTILYVCYCLTLFCIKDFPSGHHQCWNDWSCRSRKIYGCQGIVRCTNRTV